MHASTERRRAWAQGAGVAAAIAVVAGWAAATSQQMAAADELKIPIAEARSQAAELHWLASEPGRGLPRTFIHAQYTQLQKNIERTRSSLDGLKPADALKTTAAQAKPHVEALRPETGAAALQAHEQALAALEQGLKR